MPTIKDVAALAGVSVSTVSIVINGKQLERKVAAETTKKVQRAIDTLGYKPNMSARQLKSMDKLRPVIALYWPLDYRTAYLAMILQGLQSEAVRINYDCEIVVATFKSDELESEFNVSTKFRFSGAIIGATSQKDMEYLKTFTPPIPTVLFNRQLESYDSVINNYLTAGQKVSQLLWSKGHRNISIFTLQNPYLALSERTKSVLRACREIGIDVPEDNIIHCENSYEGGALAARRYMELDPRPTALFCDTDFIALGAIYFFNKSQVKIPDDLEMIAIGMADPEITLYSTPSITIVTIPTREMAADCLNILFMRSHQNGNGIQNKIHNPSLLMRESCQI